MESLEDAVGSVWTSRTARAARSRSNAPDIAVPVVVDLHSKIYSAASQQGALDMGSYHRCETTHCRAGWVITLAGVEGKRLEERLGSLVAAIKIYDASCPGFEINPCRFFDSNEKALEDMRKLAQGA